MDRRLLFSYWLARIGLNGFVIGVFWLLTKAIGVEFSWWLYWSAFSVYAMLGFGDALINRYWPNANNEHL